MNCKTCLKPNKLLPSGICPSCDKIARYGPGWWKKYQKQGICKKCQRSSDNQTSEKYCRKCHYISKHGIAKWKALKKRSKKALKKKLARSKLNAICAICQATGRLDRDHAHNLPCGHGKGETPCKECVRGFLCRRCNVGLEHFLDSPALLEEAKKYLISWAKV